MFWLDRINSEIALIHGLPQAEDEAGFSVPTEVREWARLDITAGWRRAGGAAAAAASAAAAGSAGLRAWVRRVYPWIHAGKEAAVLAFLVLFLFNRTTCSRSASARITSEPAPANHCIACNLQCPS